MQVVDRFEEIRFALAVLAYDRYAFWRQGERDVRQVTDIANFEVAEPLVRGLRHHRELATCL